MRLVDKVCAENRQLTVVLANPVMKEKTKAAIVREIFEHHVNEATLLFLVFVVSKRRSVNLKGIAQAYVELYREERGIVLATFTTAQNVDSDVLADVSTIVGNYVHKQVELQTKVDEDIIGGFSIDFNNYMYDARISTYVSNLKKEFSENMYERKL